MDDKIQYGVQNGRRSPLKPMNGHNSVTINSNLMILVSIPMFSGTENTLKP